MWLIKKEKIKQRMDVMPQPNNNTNESGNRNQQKKAKRMKEGQKTHSEVSAGPVSAKQLNKQTAIQQSSKGKDGRTDINDHNRHPLSSSSSGGNIIGLYHLRLNIIRNIVGKNKKEIIENMRRQGLFSLKFSKISVKNYEIELKWNSRDTSLTHNLCLMSSIEFGKIL